jgi:hypothetical protein
MASGHDRVEAHLPLTLIDHKLEYDEFLAEIRSNLLT